MIKRLLILSLAGLLLLSFYMTSCVDKTTKERTEKESAERSLKLQETLKIIRAETDPEFIKRLNQVKEILDKMGTPEFWEQKVLELERSILTVNPRFGLAEEKYGKKSEPSVQEEIDFSVKNKDVALPLIFERLNRDGVNVSDWAGKSYAEFRTPRTPCGLKTRQLIIFFYIFWETKSIESIPYLCEFLHSIPKEIDTFYLGSIGCAQEAISAITERKVHKVELYYHSYGAIANLAQEWYEEYKKSAGQK
jgi:hypothetical protein